MNMAMVLKAKVKGSVNICQCDLQGTQRDVRDFKQACEVTEKATAKLKDCKKSLPKLLVLQDPEVGMLGTLQDIKRSENPMRSESLLEFHLSVPKIYVPNCPDTILVSTQNVINLPPVPCPLHMLS